MYKGHPDLYHRDRSWPRSRFIYDRLPSAHTHVEPTTPALTRYPSFAEEGSLAVRHGSLWREESAGLSLCLRRQVRPMRAEC